MPKIFIGPLWGNLEWITALLNYSHEGEMHFYGAYHFFGTNGPDVINQLKKQKNLRQMIFHRSRFEEAFMISANLMEEKEYHFRRWLNPFSGILSAIESYGVDPLIALADPENLYEALSTKDIFQCHKSFHEELESGNFPARVEQKIEKSIMDRSAFHTLSLYDEEGSRLHSITTEAGLLDEHTKKVMKLMEIYGED